MTVYLGGGILADFDAADTFPAGAQVIETVDPGTSSTAVVNFDAADTFPSGITRTLPPSGIIVGFDANGELPTLNRVWRAVLVDSTGTVLAQIPNAKLGNLTETLNDITTADVIVPFYNPNGTMSEAAQVIAAAYPLPEVEMQIWRGDHLMLWGPVTDDNPGPDGYQLTVSDAAWWLSRRYFGKLGNDLGGVSGGLRKDYLSNPDFTAGLDGWAALHTTAFGAVPGFGAIAPGAFAVVTTPSMPSGAPMMRAIGPIGDPNDGYRLYQDLVVSPSPNRPLKIRFTGYVHIPSTGGFMPTNDTYGILLAWMPYGTPVPSGYYNAVEDATSNPTGWIDEETPRDRLVPLMAEIDIPPGENVVLLHVAICAPQGVTYWGGFSLRGDDGFFFYDQPPTGIAARLIEHGSNPLYDKDDVNLGALELPDGALVTREYIYEDHPNLLSAVHALSSDGWYDWATIYTGTTRLIGLYGGTRGAHQPAVRLHLDSVGHGNIADLRLRRDWGSGATNVAAQDQGTTGKHERSARVAGAKAIEELFTAGREPKDYDLAGTATERLAVLATPHTIEIDALPADDTLIVGVGTGDTFNVDSSKVGAVLTGRHRLVRRTINMTADTAVLTVNPAAN